MEASQKGAKGAGRWIFTAVLIGLLGYAVLWPQIKGYLEKPAGEGTLIVLHADGTPAVGAEVKMLNAEGESMGLEKVDSEGRVDLQTLEWDRLLISAKQHGFVQRAVVRGGVKSWPLTIQLEGP